MTAGARAPPKQGTGHSITTATSVVQTWPPRKAHTPVTLSDARSGKSFHTDCVWAACLALWQTGHAVHRVPLHGTKTSAQGHAGTLHREAPNNNDLAWIAKPERPPSMHDLPWPLPSQPTARGTSAFPQPSHMEHLGSTGSDEGTDGRKPRASGQAPSADRTQASAGPSVL